MRFEIFRFPSVSSTNDVAISLIKKEKKISGCVYAETQTKGRGTYGKKWISYKGNLFISIFFHLKENYPPFNEFSVISPLIVSETIKHFCKDKTVSLKFPNDVFLNGKKICGILQETITFNKKKFLIIGIGMNVVSNPKIIDLYEATNILFETKKKINIKTIIDLIIISYEKFFKVLNLYKYENYKNKAETMSLK
tara:strand:+ start:1449 stop:2033 length:585 start_codon:yes stop_codon:yes gene_type:complete